jgi:hypothetical protein
MARKMQGIAGLCREGQGKALRGRTGHGALCTLRITLPKLRPSPHSTAPCNTHREMLPPRTMHHGPCAAPVPCPADPHPASGAPDGPGVPRHVSCNSQISPPSRYHTVPHPTNTMNLANGLCRISPSNSSRMGRYCCRRGGRCSLPRWACGPVGEGWACARHVRGMCAACSGAPAPPQARAARQAAKG